MSSVPVSGAGAQTARETPYVLLGGETALRAIVERFYDLMELDSAYAPVRAAHGKDLNNAREKLFMFLSGWLGGPNLYIERHGHPMLRARHLPFSIGNAERDSWLACMAQALIDCEVDDGLRQRLLHAFHGTADWMRNRAD